MVFEVVVVAGVRTAVERRGLQVKKAEDQLSCAPSADPRSTSCSLSANPRPSLKCPDMHAGLSRLASRPWAPSGIGGTVVHPTRNRLQLIGLLEGGVKRWPLAAGAPPHPGRWLA